MIRDVPVVPKQTKPVFFRTRGQVECLQVRGQCDGILKIDAAFEDAVGYRAVKRAGIQIPVLKLFGKQPADRCLAGARRPVDGDRRRGAAVSIVNRGPFTVPAPKPEPAVCFLPEGQY